jgi:hypothetical protein
MKGEPDAMKLLFHYAATAAVNRAFIIGGKNGVALE